MSRYRSRVSGFEKAPRCSTAFPAMICFTATSTFLPLRVYCQRKGGGSKREAFKPQVEKKNPSALLSGHIEVKRPMQPGVLVASGSQWVTVGKSLSRVCFLDCKMGTPATTQRLWVNWAVHGSQKCLAITPFFCLFVSLFLAFIRATLWHVEVPRLGVQSKLQLPAYATARSEPHLRPTPQLTAMRDP